MRWILFTGFLAFLLNAVAQDDILQQIEINHKECVALKEDSVACARIYFNRMDSLLPVVFAKANAAVPSGEKAQFLKEQLTWNARKDIYFKKQDENFIFNLKDGTWKKDMIRFVYEGKADFLLKRIKLLQKKSAP